MELIKKVEMASEIFSKDMYVAKINMWDTAEQTEQENRLWNDSKSIQTEYIEITSYVWCFRVCYMISLVLIESVYKTMIILQQSK